MCALETKRLLLRKFHVNDAKDFFDLNNDPEVLKFVAEKPYASVEAAANFIAQYKDYDVNGYGRLTVILKETAEIIGWCGLKFRKEENETDIGFRLKQKFWNKGYATEAATFCLKYGFEKLGLPYIAGRVMKGNIASITVLEKLGLKFIKEREFYEHPGLYYTITKDDYFKQ